jgi:hypothetical protein
VHALLLSTPPARPACARLGDRARRDVVEIQGLSEMRRFPSTRFAAVASARR